MAISFPLTAVFYNINKTHKNMINDLTYKRVRLFKLLT